LFEIIKSSKEYKYICDETIQRVINAAIPKYKTEKLALKSVKSTLREISAAFLSDADIKKANANISDTAYVLTLHQSTRERTHHFKQMIEDIKQATGFKSVFDIGCGFQPFSIPFVEVLRGVEYYGMDIHEGIIQLVNNLFNSLSIKGGAFTGDILVKTPEIEVDCVFMFKLLPLLERMEKGGARRVLNELNFRYAAISFPTKTLSGKNVGMKDTYNAFVRNELGEFPVIMDEEYRNEILYVLVNPKRV